VRPRPEGGRTTSPLVVDGTAVVGSRGASLKSFDSATERWNVSFEGFGANPVVAGDYVVVAGLDGVVYAFTR
jgi:outer membrane protein assembly factor BamB